jgi:ketosteroid isomerase-like protein
MNTAPSNSETQQRVNQAIIRFFDGIAASDLAMIRACVTENFVILENGEVWNMDTFAAKINELKALSPTRVNQLDFILTEINDSTALVVYNNAADMTIKGHPLSMRWMESAFLLKEGEEWKIRMLHSTRLNLP